MSNMSSQLETLSSAYNCHTIAVISFLLEKQLRCCGASGFNDYHRYGMEIPISCGGEFTNFINQEVNEESNKITAKSGKIIRRRC